MIGIDLGGTKIEAAVLAADGALRWRQRVATPRDDYAATLQAMAGLVAAAERDTGHTGQTGLSVGVGGPGTLTAEGLLKNGNSVWLNGRPIERDLSQLLRRPVRYTNDANCLALSEATDGAGAGCNLVFAVILGTGTGAGIAINGRVLQGPNGLAGEWGHNPLPWGDESEPRLRCWCGQQGCVETLLSGPGLAQDHALRHAGAFTGEAIVALAQQGDAAAVATLARYSQRLARALAGIINLLDPNVIVLGGGLSRLAHLYDTVPQQWGQWVFGANTAGQAGVAEPVRTRLLPAAHGDASGVRGAAWLGATAA